MSNGAGQPVREAAALLARGDWQAAHELVQANEALPHAAWAHGIVHILEGDLDNARYWYGRAGRRFPEAPSAEDELRALRAALDAG